MKKKLMKSALLTLLFSFLFSLNVSAAGFTQDAAGIHYQNDDGTVVTSSWVEVSGLWFLFDADGVCVNPDGAPAPDDTDGNYQIVTSYTPFATADAALLNQCLADGTVVSVEGQYFITPQASTVMRNADPAAKEVVVDPEPEPEQQIQPDTTQKTAVETPKSETRYVWLSATGSKYHSIDHCGNMNPKKARQVTLEQALNLGKGKCSKCW